MFNYDNLHQCIFRDDIICNDIECNSECVFYPYKQPTKVVQSTERQLTIEDILCQKNKN